MPTLHCEISARMLRMQPASHPVKPDPLVGRGLPWPISPEEYEASRLGWSTCPTRHVAPACKSMYSNTLSSLIRAAAFPGPFEPTISSANVVLQVRPGLTLEVPMIAFRYGCLSLHRKIR